MYRITIFIFCYIFIQASPSHSQQTLTFDEVNTRSYSLYEKGQWKELIQLGKEALAEGHDFLLLRLRLGYAAFMMQNYSAAIPHYESVLKDDSYNQTAHYFLWLSRKYLNQQAIGDRSVKFLDKETRAKEQLKSFALTEVGNETSYKQTDISARENSIYSRIETGLRLGWNIHMVNAVMLYNQVVREPKLRAVLNNNNIQVNQKEFYNKTLINVSSKWQAKLGYHFLYTPFNNFVYYNHVAIAGLTYFGNYYDIGIDANYARLTDSTSYQYNARLGVYPLGNLNLYSFSTVMVRNSSQETTTNIKQVIGFKLLPKVWVEVNSTLGRFNNLLENDALYVYNAIDVNTFKTGGSIYFTASPKVVLQAGYTFEKRELYKTLITFNQHSITGGITCKF